MVEMGADVEVHAAAPLVDLGKAVAGHGKRAGVQVLEVLGRTELTRLGKSVAADIVVCDEILLQAVRQLDKGGAGVGKLGVATGALRRQLDGTEEGEAGSTKVVAGIGMEELVALDKGVSLVYIGRLRGLRGISYPLTRLV